MAKACLLSVFTVILSSVILGKTSLENQAVIPALTTLSIAIKDLQAEESEDEDKQE